MRVKIATIRAWKAQIPDSGWFLRKNSTNRAQFQMQHSTPALEYLNAYMKELGLIKTAFIKNSDHENKHSVKTLDFEKDIHNDKQKQKNLNFDKVPEKTQFKAKE